MVHWNDIIGKPAVFAPATHAHTAAQITDLHEQLWDSSNLAHDSVTMDALAADVLAALTPEDTGWVDLVLNSGYVSRGSTYRPQARRVGKTIFVRGQLDRTNSPAASAGGVACALPGVMAPGAEVQIPVKVGGAAVNSWIRAGGDIYLSGSDTAALARYQVLDVVFGVST